MRLINGSFAFFLMLCLSAIFPVPSSGTEFFPIFLCALIYYHSFWFINTRNGMTMMDRFGYNVSMLAFGTPALCFLCGYLSHIAAFSTVSLIAPTITFIAVADSLYCLKVIVTSLPPSLVGRAKPLEISET